MPTPAAAAPLTETGKGSKPPKGRETNATPEMPERSFNISPKTTADELQALSPLDGDARNIITTDIVTNAKELTSQVPWGGIY